jgi:hypothetical protein
MLSERERHLLELIEAELAAGDKRFADAVLALLGVVAVVVTGHWAAVLALVAIAVVALIRFVRRRLD